MFTKFVLDDKGSVVYIKDIDRSFDYAMRRSSCRKCSVQYYGYIDLERIGVLAIPEEYQYTGVLFVNSDGRVYLELRIAGTKTKRACLGSVGIFLRSIAATWTVGCDITVSV